MDYFLKSVIWGGKTSVLVSEISFDSKAPMEPKNTIWTIKPRIYPGLQIKSDNKDSSEIIFLISQGKHTHGDPSSEPSSTEGSQSMYMF